MTHKLHVSESLSLPMEAITQTFAILAKRGSGKSYTASVMAEEMLKAHQPIVALDPTGGWWGLRSGFPIAVLGGEHGDIPLEKSAGDVIAQAIVENRFSAVIDLSLFRKGEMITFMMTFLETLYRLNRDAVHLFVDEADAFAPQVRMYGGGEESRMLGAMEDLVRRGRKRGIGCTLITQRPAVLNKNVLTQCESLFALRLTHHLDIKAIKEWIDVHADPAESKDVIDSLPSLPIGEAWFWSPAWMGALERVKIRKRETFDSSATPKPGEEVKKPKSLAKLDLEQLGARIQATVEHAKENDPRELKRQIADLRKQLAARPAETVTETKIERVEVPVLKNGQLEKAHGLVDKFSRLLEDVKAVCDPLAEVIGKAANAGTPAPVIHKKPPLIHQPAVIIPQTRETIHRPVSEGRLPIGEEKTLAACIQFPGGLYRNQLTVLTGYKRATRDAYIKRLREKGYLDVQGNTVMATAAGIAALPDYQPLPTGQELQDYWLNRLPRGEKIVLEYLIGIHPSDTARADLDEPTGFKRATRDAYLKRLAAKQLVVETERGRVRASDELF